MGKHLRGDPRSRGGARRAAPWACRRRHRLDDLPTRDLHRDVAREPALRPSRRLSPGGCGPLRLSRRVENGADQRAGHPSLAADCGLDSRVARLDHQHDGSGGVDYRAGRGGRRRHHRRREHHSAPASESSCERASTGVSRRPRSFPRGSKCGGLRQCDRGACVPAGLLSGRALRIVLSASGFGLCACDPCFAAGRPHGHSGAVPAVASACSPEACGTASGARSEETLSASACPP